MANKSIRMSDGTDTLLPECAIFGNNSNGFYCKFADGTLIQWYRVTSLTFSAQTILEGEVTMPLAFIDTNYVVIGNGASSSNNAYVFRLGLNPSTTQKFSWTLGSGSGSAITINNRGFYWLAIGRWK